MTEAGRHLLAWLFCLAVASFGINIVWGYKDMRLFTHSVHFSNHMLSPKDFFVPNLPGPWPAGGLIWCHLWVLKHSNLEPFLLPGKVDSQFHPKLCLCGKTRTLPCPCLLQPPWSEAEGPAAFSYWADPGMNESELSLPTSGSPHSHTVNRGSLQAAWVLVQHKWAKPPSHTAVYISDPICVQSWIQLCILGRNVVEQIGYYDSMSSATSNLCFFVFYIWDFIGCVDVSLCAQFLTHVSKI